LITASITDSVGLVASSQAWVTVAAATSLDSPTGGTTTAATLTARGYKVKGVQMADLSWGGLSASSVDIYRNGVVISTSSNDGAQTDNINKKGNGSYTYKVCEAGTSTCTTSALVTF
jgi:thermitase